MTPARNNEAGQHAGICGVVCRVAFRLDTGIQNREVWYSSRHGNAEQADGSARPRYAQIADDVIVAAQFPGEWRAGRADRHEITR